MVDSPGEESLGVDHRNRGDLPLKTEGVASISGCIGF